MAIRMLKAGGRLRHFLFTASSHSITESIFLRVLGLVYLIAFASLWVQVVGLIGSHGIVPAAPGLIAMRAELGATRAFLASPSLFWFTISDPLLVSTCLAGCLFSLLLIAGVFTRTAAALCWFLYLSFVSIGAPFLNFQWDGLLLEAGFLALFAGAPWLVWAYRFLLFRLMLQSGIVKFLSGDVNWSNLHALRFHFLTQPLPNPLAYQAFQASPGLLDTLTAATLAIEIVAPFLLFGSRRVRQVGVALLMLLQIGILLTGNYAFFNLLTLALCLWGLDDRTFAALRSWKVRRFRDLSLSERTLAVGRACANGVLAVYLILSASEIVWMFRPALLRPLHAVENVIAPFELVNRYGLFAVMTTERPELILQGSNDQTNWRDYSFPYKPGELHRGLPLVAPYQPRLDWQMWFAALGSYGENAWVGNLMYRLLVGDPAVQRLLNPPPFPKPPRYMRAVLFDYKFATPEERGRIGAVWVRQEQSIWFGPVSLTGT